MIRELTWDTGFFGRKIGRIDPVASGKELKRAISVARRQRYRYLMCRLDAHETTRIQMFEQHGFYLTDIGIVFGRDVPPGTQPSAEAAEASEKDIRLLRRMTKGLFGKGRFYHDPFFSRAEADRLYAAWIENAVRGHSCKVFHIHGKGFVACTISGDTGEIALIGVARQYRQEGVGTTLVRHAMAWFASAGVSSVTVRTQAGNTGAMRFYSRLDFQPLHCYVTLGKILVS